MVTIQIIGIYKIKARKSLFTAPWSLHPKSTSQGITTVARNMSFWNFYVLLILGEGMGAGLLQWGRLTKDDWRTPSSVLIRPPVPSRDWPWGQVYLAVPQMAPL